MELRLFWSNTSETLHVYSAVSCVYAVHTGEQCGSLEIAILPHTDTVYRMRGYGDDSKSAKLYDTHIWIRRLQFDHRMSSYVPHIIAASWDGSSKHILTMITSPNILLCSPKDSCFNRNPCDVCRGTTKQEKIHSQTKLIHRAIAFAKLSEPQQECWAGTRLDACISINNDCISPRNPLKASKRFPSQLLQQQSVNERGKGRSIW